MEGRAAIVEPRFQTVMSDKVNYICQEFPNLNNCGSLKHGSCFYFRVRIFIFEPCLCLHLSLGIN